MSLVQSIGGLLRASFSQGAALELPDSFMALLARLDEAPASRTASDREFKKLMTEAVPALRGYARKLCRDHETADDLVQEAMLKAWSARRNFTAGTNFRGWIFTILRNQFLSDVRRQKFQGEWNEPSANAKLRTGADQEHRLHLEDVSRALAKLPADQREVMLLIGADHRSYEEVAERLHLPLGTVKSRVSRGRAALERLVNGPKDD